MMLIGQTIRTVRMILTLIMLSVPTIVDARPPTSEYTIETVTGARSILLSRLERLFMGRYDTIHAPTEFVSVVKQPWFEQLERWLVLQQFHNHVNPVHRNAISQGLGFVAINQFWSNSAQRWLEIDGLTSPYEPKINQLPGACDSGRARLRIEPPVNPKARYLSASTTAIHTVRWGKKDLKSVSSHNWPLLDNIIYELPKNRLSNEIIIEIDCQFQHRTLSMRYLEKLSKTRSEFFAHLFSEDTSEQDLWFWIMIARQIDNHSYLNSQLPWIKTQAEGPAPWRYALLLLTLDALEFWSPKFDTLPRTNIEKDWWRALQYQAGLAAIFNGRLPEAYERLKVLNEADDPDTHRFRRRLFAALLNESGLSAQAAKLLAGADASIEEQQLEYDYLVNASLLSAAEENLKARAQQPNPQRDDLYQWLSHLHKSGQEDAFEHARLNALKKCPSCWQLLGVTGGELLPEMSKEELREWQPERAWLFEGVARKQLFPSEANKTRIKRDEFFDARISHSKVQPDSPIRNLSLQHTLHVDENGLSSVRIRRKTLVKHNLTNDQVSFTLDFVPERQFIKIHHVRLVRRDNTILLPTIIEESTNQPKARLYYDARRKRISFPSPKAGDIIELDWSVIDHQKDPELPGLDGWVFPFQEQWPTDWHRIEWKSDTLPLFAQLTNSPTAFGESSIERRHLKSVDLADQSETEFLILSQVNRWDELDKRYLDKLRTHFTPTPKIRETALAIIGNERRPRAQLSLLFQAVSQKVTYVGLEYGEHSRIPESPDTVWRRSLGDCKDKSALLVALAKSIGVQLEFAIVRTRLLPPIKYTLPTLAIFDHAVVYAPKWNLYFDPSQPDLGELILPAIVQGSQTHILGIGREIETIPISPPKHESVIMTVTGKEQGNTSGAIELDINGHLGARLIELDQRFKTTPSPFTHFLNRLITPLKVERYELSVLEEENSRVRVSLGIKPERSNDWSIGNIARTQIAWFNQSKEELLKEHHLPRQIVLRVPQVINQTRVTSGPVTMTNESFSLEVNSRQGGYSVITAKLFNVHSLTNDDLNSIRATIHHTLGQDR